MTNENTGIILKAISGFYYVNILGKTVECKARGNFRNSGFSPVVGDKVSVSFVDENHGTVEKIFDRKNYLSRPTVANIDKLFIVSAFSTPAPDTLMIDRLTAIACFKNIEPIIVFNKCDMGDFSKFEEIYRKAGFKTFVVSALSGEGTDRLIPEFENSVCAFAGNSGVGKSSLINAMFGDLNLQTGEVSVKLGRGRHTTRHTELFSNKYGGFVADTPGFATLDITEDAFEFKQNLANSFREFSALTENCKFTSCSHLCEKGCAVVEAVKNGEISLSRHESYKTIFEELKDLRAWNK